MLRENLQAFYKALTSDETILRLLYYKPANATDNPLDSSKTNFSDMSVEEKWSIIFDRVMTTPTYNGLDTSPICRICFYAGRRSNTNNYKVADQKIIFDIFTHFEYDSVDLRNSWICDRINELIFDKGITGIGKVTFVDGDGIASPEGYTGYRLVYSIGSAK